MASLKIPLLSGLLGLGLTVLPALIQSPSTATAPLLSPADQVRFRQTLNMAQQQNLAAQPLGQTVQAIARQYLGAPYRAGLLDQSPTEQLVISLQQFDCVLFVESVLALARTVMTQRPSPATFVNQVKAQRYRDGTLLSYCGRLHYFSDWIADNERRGLVQNVTQPLGGIPMKKSLNFMTQHRSSYPQLKGRAEFTCIAAVESRLASEPRYYIPTANIRAAYPKLQAGDVVAIATKVPGLDVTHTGLLERRTDGGVGLLHASPAGAVTRAQDLQTYVSQVPEAIGIIVARPLTR